MRKVQIIELGTQRPGAMRNLHQTATKLAVDIHIPMLCLLLATHPRHPHRHAPGQHLSQGQVDTLQGIAAGRAGTALCHSGGLLLLITADALPGLPPVFSDQFGGQLATEQHPGWCRQAGRQAAEMNLTALQL